MSSVPSLQLPMPSVECASHAPAASLGRVVSFLHLGGQCEEPSQVELKHGVLGNSL